MELQTTPEEQVSYPFITFKISGANYCISSKMVSSMTMMSDLIAIPDSPDYILGLMKHKQEIVPMLDMRTLLGMESLEHAIGRFADMIRQRKEDHIRWVKALEDSVKYDTQFTLAIDPHQCAFGKWYDSYEAPTSTTKNMFGRIRLPHEQLHACAIRIANTPTDNHEVREQILTEANKLCYEHIVPILEEVIAAYQSEIKGMAIILEDNDKLHGVMVDSVNAIEYFDYETQKEALGEQTQDNYIKSVIKAPDGTLYLEVDYQRMLELYKQPAALA